MTGRDILLFTNAQVYLGQGRWISGEVLVRDGAVSAVGADLGVAPGAACRIVDAGGAALLPAFHDAHVHPSLGGRNMLTIDLSEVHDRVAYERIVGDYAAAHPNAPVLVGGGWFGDVWGGFPSARDWDRVVPDRPLVLYSHDAHGVVVNSAALRAAGIRRGTAAPPGGRILTDADGEPTGMLIDAAVALVAGLLPEEPPETIAAALLAAQQRLYAVGVIGWQDAAVGPSELGPDCFEAYLALAREGLLPSRVSLALWWDRHRGPEQLEELLMRRDLAQAAGLSANTVKVMQDGMMENRTAAMLSPYGGTDVTGDSFIDPQTLKEIGVAVDAAGMQIHWHAVGDRAVRECLDAAEAIRNVNGERDSRHQIAHLDVVDPADVPRFGELDVIANVQMLWARRDAEILERKLPLMGSRREPFHFPFASLARAGARLAGGSDWPVTDPNPLWAIETATTRLAPAVDPHATGAEARSIPLEPQEAIPLGAALDAHTIGAAYSMRLDAVSGSIAPGKRADLVLLDRPVTAGAGISESEILGTWISGSQVYTASPP